LPERHADALRRKRCPVSQLHRRRTGILKPYPTGRIMNRT
jgi:hypothetical protein